MRQSPPRHPPPGERGAKGVPGRIRRDQNRIRGRVNTENQSGSEVGFTLIEIAVFIVIVGIAAVALLRSFSNVMPRTPTPSQIEQAVQLARERMELILKRREIAGYAAVNDPCVGGTPPAICTASLGYTVSVTGVAAITSWPANTNTALYKLVTVKVTSSGRQLAQMDAVLGNYPP